MKQAEFIQDGKVLDYVNGGSAIAYGDVIVLDNRIAIAGETIAVGATGSVHVEGVFEIDAVNNSAFVVGDKLYFDTVTEKLTKVNTNIPAGYCFEAKAETGTKAKVKLDNESAIKAILTSIASIVSGVSTKIAVANGALAAVDTAGGLFAVAIPANAIILDVAVDVTTVATGACTIDVGVAANGTTKNDALIDGQDVNAATGTFFNTAKAKATTGQFVTGSVASGASAGIVGRYQIVYALIV